MHYFKFNVADYKADTAHLDVIEHGIYFQLICWYYLDEKKIPLETQVVMRRLSLDGDMLHKLENVLSDFFIKTDKGYFHSRVESELEKYKTQFAKNRINGLDGGRPKKNPSGLTKNPSAPLTNNQEPITNNHIKKQSAKIEFLLPDWINKEHWDAWHSTPKRKNATTAQKQLAIKKLDQWRQAGIDYGLALQNAAIGGWQGLFEPKPDVRQSTRQDYQKSTTQLAKEKLFGIAEKDITHEAARV